MELSQFFMSFQIKNEQYKKKRDDYINYKKYYYVYFYYNEADILIYIGLTNNVLSRFTTRNEPWLPEVKKIGIRQYPNSITMRYCEKYYIAKLKPKYNIVGANEDILYIDIIDAVDFELISITEFKKKYENSIQIKTPKLTLKEQFTNANFSIIEADSIDLFDEKILEYNLDKTAFLSGDLIFSFTCITNNNKYSPKLLDTNSKIEIIKKYLDKSKKATEEKYEREVLENIQVVVYFEGGGAAIISGISTKQGVITTIHFPDAPYLEISENHFIVRFDKI